MRFEEEDEESPFGQTATAGGDCLWKGRLVDTNRRLAGRVAQCRGLLPLTTENPRPTIAKPPGGDR